MVREIEVDHPDFEKDRKNRKKKEKIKIKEAGRVRNEQGLRHRLC